jgi:cell division protein FtsI/penicillin-binding protein 2
MPTVVTPRVEALLWNEDSSLQDRTRMNRRIRALALVLVVCFGLLFVQLNNLQVREASELQAKSNVLLPTGQTWYSTPRGEILSSDGHVLAYSTKTSAGYVRRYPYGNLFADVTG